MSFIDKFKEFGPTSWSIDNKMTIFFVTAVILIFGSITYNNLPKTQFPDIVIPTMIVTTIYPGTSPEDMENLVTRPIEKQLKSVNGIKKISSNSIQDFAMITAEFNTDVEVAVAKQKVKDAVDKSIQDLPKDLPNQPNVIEVDFSEMPMMFINISGDYDVDKLKKYAEILEDDIEAMKEITRVDLVGTRDKEVQVHVDRMKMQTAQVTFYDLEQAINFENMTISGGLLNVDGMNRAIRVKGEFENIEEIRNLTVRNAFGSPIYLRDIADVQFVQEDVESYARYNRKNVITLNVIKRSGENLIATSDKINGLIEKYKKDKFPEGLNVSITGDQSELTRTTLTDLINSTIIGFIFVLLVLMFFMGVTNAFFVALSVPLSILLAFIVMPFIGFELNMIVLFALLFALGIVVDDAIVVIENTYRLYNHGERSITQAAKMAAGEVWSPVLSGTLTTLAPFIPLAFWSGIIGKFMIYLPITLILTLISSLIVAFIINPVFAVAFMRAETDGTYDKARIKRIALIILGLTLLGLVLRSFGSLLWGNFAFFLVICVIIYHLILRRLIQYFEYQLVPAMVNLYGRLLGGLLKTWIGALSVVLVTIGLLIFSIFLISVRTPPVVFFPKGEPNFIYAYIKLPVGTEVEKTDSITKIVEEKVYSILGENNPIVESIQSNVAIGAGDPRDNDRSVNSNKAKVSVAFKKFSERQGQSTGAYLEEIRNSIKDMPGVEITVDQEANGPPTGAPVNIEIAGEDLKQLVQTSEDVLYYLDSLQIKGVEELKSDFVSNSPELVVNLNREAANRSGLSTAQIGSEIRTSVFGKEVSTYKLNEDEYPIMLRAAGAKNNAEDILNTRITYRDNTNGQVKQMPLAAIADIKYSNAYGGIKRKNVKRVITISSNVTAGVTANDVNAKIVRALNKYNFPEGVSYKLTGEQEEQAETGAFLSMALLISLGLIFIILVTQFNSISKPIIIMLEIVFSIIGVLLGFAFTGMEISIVMTGIGVVGLAGIVVKNGILIVEFADLCRENGMSLYESVVEAGKTRLKPVLLTAAAAILGLIPMALGFNINFETLFTHFDPQWFLGGDSVVFWGPLSWTIIYGLSFATILTLVVVPAMYLLNELIQGGISERLRK